MPELRIPGRLCLIRCVSAEGSMLSGTRLMFVHAPLQGRLTKEDVDLRMIKALADLPGDRGMEAVDRFSGSSLETVRSKTGFMVRRPFALLLSSRWLGHVPPDGLFRCVSRTSPMFMNTPGSS